jgi:hypothetical protein
MDEGNGGIPNLASNPLASLYGNTLATLKFFFPSFSRISANGCNALLLLAYNIINTMSQLVGSPLRRRRTIRPRLGLIFFLASNVALDLGLLLIVDKGRER